MKTTSPVGDMPFIIRADGWGNGRFGMGRGTREDGSKKFHDGLDVLVEPGQPIVSVIDGKVEKVDIPYSSDHSWKGIQIANSLLRVEIWYMEPKDIVGHNVYAGQVVGYAQDISQKYNHNDMKVAKYGLMIPHVHVRTTVLPFTALSSGRYVSFEITVDPLLFLGVE